MKRVFMTTMVAGAFVAATTAFAADPVAPPVPCPRAAAGFAPGTGPQAPGGSFGRMPGPGMRSVPGRQSFRGGAAPWQMLNLSSGQRAKLDLLRQKHFQERAAVRQERFELKQSLAAESMRQRPDERKIAAITARIGQSEERFAAMQSRHLREVAKVLDRKQVETMLQMHAGRRGMCMR